MSSLFPELEEAGGSAPQERGAPPPSETVAGAAWASSMFDKLLGLPGPFTSKGECRARGSRARPDGRVEIDIEGGGLTGRTLLLNPKGPYFDIGVQGSDADDGLRLLLGQAAHRLRGVPLARLRNVVLSDPDKRVEAAGRVVSMEDPSQAKDMQKSLVQSYGSSEAWYNFFADKEQQRNFCFNFTGSVVTVGHEDLECHWATPPTGDGSVSFFNYPRVHERYTAPEQAPKPGEAPAAPKKQSRDASYLISDLHDLDIIKGGTKKLDDLLDGILERETKPDMVIMRATCVPIVIGDDMEGSVERFKAKSDVPIVFLDNIADQFATPFRETFKRLKDDPEFQNPKKNPGSLNLVGFPKAAEMQSLLGFLGSLGAKVNCRVVPEVDLAAMKAYRAADVSVLFDTELYTRTYDDVIGGIEHPTIRPPAPYGVAASRRWLLEIATALGLQKGFDEAWAKYLGGSAKEWDALRAEAQEYRLGFVVDSERIKMLLDPRKTTGVPMASMLKEMGFGLDFLLYVPPDTPAEDLKRFEARSRHDARVLTFSTPDQLRTKLLEADAQAFYSEVFFDKRLTRCGKSQFSVNAFEMGVGGAVSTLKRLLGTLRTPFYRKYGGYLGEAFE